jgi:hypothetical protein
MKKLSLLSNLAMVLGLSILIVSCTKQQDAVVADTPTDAAVIKNISGFSNGKISRSDAEEMHNTYKKNAGSGATEYVSFKIADLQAYLAALQAKGKTDEVNVYLAVYDAKTATNSKYIDRTTFYFGPGVSKSRIGDRGRIGSGLIVFDDNADYMNHGNIWP